MWALILAQGKVPVQTYSRELPQHLELQLDDGLAISGLVRDEEGNPLAGARVEALGEIARDRWISLHPGRGDV